MRPPRTGARASSSPTTTTTAAATRAAPPPARSHLAGAHDCTTHAPAPAGAAPRPHLLHCSPPGGNASAPPPFARRGHRQRGAPAPAASSTWRGGRAPLAPAPAPASPSLRPAAHTPPPGSTMATKAPSQRAARAVGGARRAARRRRPARDAATAPAGRETTPPAAPRTNAAWLRSARRGATRPQGGLPARRRAPARRPAARPARRGARRSPSPLSSPPSGCPTRRAGAATRVRSSASPRSLRPGGRRVAAGLMAHCSARLTRLRMSVATMADRNQHPATTRFGQGAATGRAAPRPGSRRAALWQAAHCHMPSAAQAPRRRGTRG